MEKRQVRLAVRDFVESMFMEGDLVSASSPGRALEGMRVHTGMQAGRGEEYSSEVPVSFSIAGEFVELQLFGRIDGLTVTQNGATIEEIKSVRGFPIEGGAFRGREVHWAQAKVYAAIWCADHGLERISVQLVYFDVNHAAERRFEQAYTAGELLAWLTHLCGKYLLAADREERRLIENSRTIREMGFPYDRIRPGQEEMMAAVYSQVRSGGYLYVSAPTGIGKTMGALFPAVKALADGHCRKLFYLTARNPVKAVAEEALKTLISRGFALRCVTLASKDRLCPMPEGTPCAPEHCPHASGFYDRLPHALDELAPVGHIAVRDLEKLALKHRLCPHELSLCVAEACDVVICDYNHAFDPRVRIKRFFERGGDYMLLVDEAHNLVDRGRDMFSAELTEAVIHAFLDGLPLFLPEGMEQAVSAAQALLERLKDMTGALVGTEEETALESVPDALLDAAGEFLDAAEPLLARLEAGGGDDGFLDLYFMVRTFLDVEEERDERFRVMLRRAPDGAELRLRCLDPSKKLREAMRRVRGAIFFSATLTPFQYFTRLTGGGGDVSCLRLPSPFPRENLKVLALDIETTYAKRDSTVDRLAEALAAFVGGKKGNYLVFFPSYRYMQAAHDSFARKSRAFAPMQTSGMTERERMEFLRFFDASHDRGMAAFAVMGGIFGEGIDLVGDKVVGVAIVGVGMPQLCLERNLMQHCFDDADEPGYDYAYTIPGFNRVMQAVGRLIRSEEDRGVVLLADRRFGWPKYDEMTPECWQPVSLVRSAAEIQKRMREFWADFEAL